MKWMTEQKKISDLTGAWSLLFKLNSILVLPSLIGFGVWVVKSVNSLDVRVAVLEQWKSTRPVFVTSSDVQALEYRVKEELAKSNAAKTEVILSVVTDLKVDLSKVRTMLEEHMKQRP